ncbi:MAG TPA: HU family DNA-binding protein [Treponemataceae bacterium]|jgi:nucleoid DNA-binding protein|nr:HU family DNA-binding protein [Treponemataceae bacterium]
MEKKVYGELPEEIRKQIDALLEGENGTAAEERREQYARIWKKKFDLFTGQVANVGLEIVKSLEKDDPRAMILLTYSGSLVSMGPAQNGKRWLEYASIKFRSDVPDFVTGQGVSLAGPVKQDSTVGFDGSTLKQSSAIYRIAVCPAGMTPGDQDQRVREATIYLTNGFVKINRTMNGESDVGLDQFSPKAIIAYVAKKNGITQTAARGIVEDYLSTVEAGVLLGERVTVGKLGAISLKLHAPKKARVMKHITTGEDILVPAKPASLAPKFSFSRAMKDKGLRTDPALIASGEADEDDEE